MRYPFSAVAVPPKLKPLWRCPHCGERFVKKNMAHSCAKSDLKTLFAKSEPQVRKLFTMFTEIVRGCGPVHLIPQRTKVAFQVRVRFASCTPRGSYVLCGFWLKRRINSPRFRSILQPMPHDYIYQVRIDSTKDFDAEFRSWIREAYAVGQQKHLTNTLESKSLPTSVSLNSR